MTDVVQYLPAQLEAAEAALAAGLSSMKQHGDDEMSSMTQFVNESSGQFTQAIEEQKNKITHIQEDASQTVHQIISALEQARISNTARDIRSASGL